MCCGCVYFFNLLKSNTVFCSKMLNLGKKQQQIFRLGKDLKTFPSLNLRLHRNYGPFQNTATFWEIAKFLICMSDKGRNRLFTLS